DKFVIGHKFSGMRFISTLLFILTVFQVSFAQVNSNNLVKYGPEFKFKEGIYLNFEQVKANDPLPKSRIISVYDSSDPEFFDKILQKDKLNYFDVLGNKHELKVNTIWGYSRNGFIYVRMPDGFFRITQVGAISHFVASYTTYTDTYNPYYYNHYNPYSMYPGTREDTEIRQYLLDFINGRILDYTDESLSILLMADPELHDEYSSLRKKKKKQMRFIYLRKFNERHPLYFPQN
ncbi:MAG: hypothetical protein JW801_05380, partial [Bacteroidales bacterium]|nr:hypothetical protein [Bacteroidales bacterium]